MKRHKSLIREILEYAEENADDGLSPCVPKVTCFTAHEIDYHIRLCAQAGFIEIEKRGSIKNTNLNAYSIKNLTWHGHEELDRLRSQ